MTLTLRMDAPTAEGDTIPKGSVVKYLGHVPGGGVAVKWKGNFRVINPITTVELADS